MFWHCNTCKEAHCLKQCSYKKTYYACTYPTRLFHFILFFTQNNDSIKTTNKLQTTALKNIFFSTHLFLKIEKRLKSFVETRRISHYLELR